MCKVKHVALYIIQKKIDNDFEKVYPKIQRLTVMCQLYAIKKNGIPLVPETMKNGGHNLYYAEINKMFAENEMYKIVGSDGIFSLSEIISKGWDINKWLNILDWEKALIDLICAKFSMLSCDEMDKIAGIKDFISKLGEKTDLSTEYLREIKDLIPDI